MEVGKVDFHGILETFKHYQTSRPSAGLGNTSRATLDSLVSIGLLMDHFGPLYAPLDLS